MYIYYINEPLSKLILRHPGEARMTLIRNLYLYYEMCHYF